MKTKTKVLIFDTTLRDGEQSPGFSMNLDEKLRFARQLERLGVDVIEAGFPVASEGDFLSVQRIAREVRKTQVAALARIDIVDIDRAWEAVQDAALPRIHIFTSGSDVHIKHMLRSTRAEVLKKSVQAVHHTRGYTDNVEFSMQDAMRSDKNYICDMVEAVIDAGATTVNIPDTVGYAIPEEYGALFAWLFEKVKNIDRTVISTHCHDDLGLAVANSLSAVVNGARQVECTVNGIGERAGNASLEEIVMALETRRDLMKLTTNIKTDQLYRTSHLLTELTGIPVQPNKAIVGANAFAHEAGIHQDGVIKERTTYEIMTPESVGIPASAMILGKHSGRNALKEKLKSMGYSFSKDEVDAVFLRFKEIADLKKEVFDEDIEAIISEIIFRKDEKYKLMYLNVICGNATIPTSTVRMIIDGEEVQDAEFGVGPVDSTFKAVRKITRTDHQLIRYAVNAITSGADAQGVVTVELKYNDHTLSGRGADPDIMVASAKAYINALNRIEVRKQTEHNH